MRREFDRQKEETELIEQLRNVRFFVCLVFPLCPGFQFSVEWDSMLFFRFM